MGRGVGERSTPETIGQRLRRLRLERGLSQRELASPGVSYAYISRIEAGARRPSVKALRMLASKLGVSAEYLETGSDMRPVDERELRIADAELALRLAEDAGAAEEAVRRVLEEAVAAGDAASALRARIALGLAAAQAGRNSEAVSLLEEAVGSRAVSATNRPDVFAALGRCYSALGEPARAVELFERCLDEVGEHAPEDVSASIRFATYLSYALSDMNDFARAQNVLEDALGRVGDLGDPYTRIRLYWSLARLNEIRGEQAAALESIRRAIALLEVTEDTLHLARAHMMCGTIIMSQGGGEEAAPQFEAAERLLGRSPDPLDLGQLRTEQARLATRLGRAQEAVARAREAIEILSDEYRFEKGSAWFALAEALVELEDVDAADDAFRQATTLLTSGPKTYYAEAYRAWGRFLRKVGREQDALDVLDRAAEIAATTTPAGAPPRA